MLVCGYSLNENEPNERGIRIFGLSFPFARFTLISSSGRITIILSKMAEICDSLHAGPFYFVRISHEFPKAHNGNL
jgi:hypothetical protein